MKTRIKMVLENKLSWKQKAARIAASVIIPFTGYLAEKTARGDVPVQPVCVNQSVKFNPTIHKNIIAWEEYSAEKGDSDIHAKNIETGEEFPVCTAEGSQRAPSIDGNIIIWQDRRSGNKWDIYGKNIVTGKEITICTSGINKTNPAIYLDTVVFEDDRNGGGSVIYSATLPQDFMKTLSADLNNDGKVDLEDFAVFANQWDNKEAWFEN